jgi:hypothetical protein
LKLAGYLDTPNHTLPKIVAAANRMSAIREKEILRQLYSKLARNG